MTSLSQPIIIDFLPSPSQKQHKKGEVSSSATKKGHPRNAAPFLMKYTMNQIGNMYPVIALATLKCILKRAINTIMTLSFTYSAPLVHVHDSTLFSRYRSRLHWIGDEPHWGCGCDAMRLLW